ncbi:MAG: hypothetical protein U1F48_20435 [Burkholderiales bacterium]
MRALLGAMLAAVTLQSHAVIPASEQAQAVEFYHAGLDHYFITADTVEKSDLDTGKHPGWVRTGYEFPVIKSGSTYAGSQPVCRFYAGSFSSHFYSAKVAECDAVKAQFANTWGYESGEVFRAFLVDAVTGKCPADTTPVTRLWNNRTDVNHRYSDQYQIYQFMTSKGYVAEGDGPATFPAAFCAPTPGSVYPTTASAGAPDCTIAVTPNKTPAVNTNVTLTATCTNNPTSYAWQGGGCTGTTSSCTTTETTPGAKTYVLYASNTSAPAVPTPTSVTWSAAAGTVPVCNINASSATPTVGSSLTLSTTCSNSPTKIEWRECGYLIPDICNIIPACPTASTSCTISATAAGLTLYAVDGVNASGTGPIVKTTVEWKSGAGGGGGGGGGGGTAIPNCSILPSEISPFVGSNLTLFASCTGIPTTFTWTGVSCTAVQCSATSSTPGTQTYSLTASNAAGVSAETFVSVNWRTTAPTPFCTLAASTSSPQTGTTVTITASCVNNPTTFVWTGCASNSGSCTDSVTTAQTKVYTLVASNAQGTGNNAQVSVNWTAPPTAKPNCNISASTTSPTVGQQVTLNATCDGSPTAYDWTGCTSTTSTCTATATASGAVTYYVAGTNQYGKGQAAGVIVTWQSANGGGGGGGAGGSDFCSAYSNVIRTSVAWNERAYVETTSLGGFAGNGVLVVSFVAPSTPTSYTTAGRAQFGELFDGPTFRQMTLSKSACDFRPYDATGVNGPYTVSNGTSAFMIWNVGAPPISLTPGQTYYFNIRNYSVDLGTTSCANSQCNGLFEAYWPH